MDSARTDLTTLRGRVLSLKVLQLRGYIDCSPCDREYLYTACEASDMEVPVSASCEHGRHMRPIRNLALIRAIT